MTKRAAHYATRIAKDICKHIAMGKTLDEALKEVGYLAPSMPTVWRWLDEYPEFRDMYERARTLQADVHADKMLEMSREVIKTPTVAAAYRVAIDVLKWQAEVRNRAKYSTRGTEEAKRPMDPTKIKEEIRRLEKELGIQQSKVVKLAPTAGTK